MFPKFEYDNLYKFVVSLGVLAASAALALPVLLLRSSGSLRVRQDELDALTPTARGVIDTQQRTLRTALDWWPTVSIPLLVLGAATCYYGLRQWQRRQAELDAEQRLANQERELRIKSMTPQEIEQKQAAEIDAAQEPDQAPNTPTVNDAKRAVSMAHIRDAEAVVAAHLLRAFGHEYEVRTNVRAFDFSWDVFLLSRDQKPRAVGVDVRLVGGVDLARRVRDARDRVAAVERLSDSLLLFVSFFVYVHEPPPAEFARLDELCRGHGLHVIGATAGELADLSPRAVGAALEYVMGRPGFFQVRDFATMR